MIKSLLFLTFVVVSIAVKGQTENGDGKLIIDTVRIQGFFVYESSTSSLKPDDNRVSLPVDIKSLRYFVPLAFSKRNKLLVWLQKLKSSFTDSLFLICNDDDILYSKGLEKFLSADCWKVDSLTKSNSYVFKNFPNRIFDISYVDALWVQFPVQKFDVNNIYLSSALARLRQRDGNIVFYPFKIYSIKTNFKFSKAKKASARVGISTM